MADTPGDKHPLMPFSCYQCRDRKLKCDRLKSGCSRCGTAGERCEYPDKRKKPVITVTRPKVRGLEARVTELELRLKEAQAQQAQSSQSPTPSSPWLESELIGTGRFEQLPPQSLVEELTNIYFTSLHPEAPMLHPSRYIASLYLPPRMQPPMCLQYAVLAKGALLSPSYGQLSQAFYRRSRHYLEEDEMRGEGQDFVTLAHAQTWVLLAMFEAQNLWFSRAAMSTSRCVRMAQILGLHDLDGVAGLGPTLLPPRDWCEQEERRRTLWVIFCTDRDTSSTTGWPHLLDPTKIQALLPASEEAYQIGIEEPAATLQEALSHNSTRSSDFACRIVAVHLFHECLDHTYAYQNSSSSIAFWKRHRDLDNGLATAFIMLPDGLRCPANIHNHQAVFVNLQLHTATICLHRSGAERAKLDGTDMTRSRSRLLPTAHEIFAIIAVLREVDALFRNPFVAFAAYMAAFVFLEDYAATQTRSSEEKLNALLALMITIGHKNPVTASLAVQMAHELQATGIDPSALDKVHDLFDKVELRGPLLAQKNAARGVVFCPFELPMDAIPNGVPAAYPSSMSNKR